MTTTEKPSVLVLYNQTGEDEYEKLKTVDPSSLDFKPVYNLAVATVAEEYAALAEGLKAAGYRARLANVENDTRKLIAAVTRGKTDVIFNLVEYFREDPALEGSVAGVLDVSGIPYTEAPPGALILCQRKGYTKQILSAHGVPTPRFRLLHHPRIPRRHGLRYPLIVKPAREDASSGVTKDSVVRDYPSLIAQVEKVFAEFAPPVLVEEFIEGRELHVSVLGNNPPQVLPVIEFDFSDLPDDHPNLISYAMKWSPLDQSYHQVHSVCPAVLSKRELKRVSVAVLEAYTLTGCRDYARVDLRMNAAGEVFVLEVNPNPDLTAGVSFMESAEKAGLSFSRTLGMIAGFAMERRKPPAAPAAG